MIAFQLKNGFLEISPSVQMTLMATNPFFDVDNVGRAYTFDFNLERSSQNDKLLKHLYRLDSTATTTGIRCNMYVGGTLYEVGALSVQDIADGYKCYFQSDAIISTDILNRDLSYFLDTITLFTDGATDIQLEWIIAFLNHAIPENQDITVSVNGQNFTVTLVYNATNEVFEYEQAANDFVSSIGATFPLLDIAVFNTYTVKITSNTPSVSVTAIENCYIISAFIQAEYEHNRIVKALQTLLSDGNAPVAFPPIYAPNALTENTAYQQYQILNNLVSPVSFALSWYISWLPEAVPESQQVQVTVLGQLFELTLIYNATTEVFEYEEAAKQLGSILTVAFPSLTISILNNISVKIESPTGSLVNIDPVLNCFTGAINGYPDNYGKIVENTIQSTKIWHNSIVPMVKVSHVFNKIAEKLNLTLGGEVWANDEFKKLIIFNTVTIDEIMTHVNSSGIEQFINRWKKEIVLADHLPKMTAKDFLNSLGKQFGFYYTMSNQKLLIRWKKDLFTLSPHDWTKELIPESIRRTPRQKKGITITYEHDNEAPSYEYPAAFDALKIGEGGMDYTFDFDTPTIIDVNKKGYNRIIHWWGKTESAPKMILILRGGTFGNSNTLTYQFATNDDKNSLGIAIPNAWTLAIQGANGIYQRFIKEIISTLEADAVSAQFELRPEHIAQLQKGEINRIISQTPLGELHAIVEQINLKISNNRVETATVDMKKI